MIRAMILSVSGCLCGGSAWAQAAPDVTGQAMYGCIDPAYLRGFTGYLHALNAAR